MGKIRAAITGINAWAPEYKLTNQELSKMVDTSDEWIMQRVGIKERRILKEEGLGSSDLGEQAVRGLLLKTNTAPEDVDFGDLRHSHSRHVLPGNCKYYIG